MSLLDPYRHDPFRALVGYGRRGEVCALVSWAGIRAPIALVPQDLSRFEEIRLDGPVMLFALGVTLLATVSFGLLPPLRVTVGSLNEALRQGDRVSRDRWAGSAAERRL